MKIAINQPFFFPYIGFFQLLYYVDKFILYDDVTYMKQSWINRNRILVSGQSKYFTIPLIQASSNKLICDTYISNNKKNIEKTLKMIKQSYSKAPFFSDIISIIERCFDLINYDKRISNIAKQSLQFVCEYLEIEVEFEFSSKKYADTQNLGREERLFEILKRNNATDYLNLPGGVNLYTKKAFKDQGLNIFFIDRGEIKYKQFNNPFVPWLSIIDILMFNSISKTRELIKRSSLR